MASWDSYVQNLEKGKGQCKYAAIYGKQGGCWAESASKAALNPSPEEINNAGKIVANNDMSVMGTGISMGGQKFTCIRFEPDLLTCQGKGDLKDYSLVVGTTGSAVILGFNPAPEIKTAVVRESVEVIKNHLKDAGY